jgi:hypothetical protein
LCDCQAYLYDRWSPTHAKECAHITGNDGLDGAAAWLEGQAKRRDLSNRQRAIATSSLTDPHRIYVRVERERRASGQPSEPRNLPVPTASEHVEWGQAIRDDAPDDPKHNRRADASKGHRLEDFFNR